MADHFGLEPGMLWVRIPPELLEDNYVLVEQPGVLACLSRQEIAGSNPVGDASSARYANWQSGEAQTFVILWVRLPPVLLDRVVLLVAACKAVVTKQARWTTRGSIPSQPTVDGPFVYRQEASPSSSRGGFDSRTGH